MIRGDKGLGAAKLFCSFGLLYAFQSKRLNEHEILNFNVIYIGLVHLALFEVE